MTLGPFKLREPISGGDPPAGPFGLNDNGNALHEVLRLLLGTTETYQGDGDIIIPLRQNELRKHVRRRSRPEKIVNLVFGSDLDIDDYTRLLNTVGLRNANFFRQVRSELILCLVAKKQKRYTESFLYLYRILEYISVAFPMLYALSHQDFIGSQAFLKSLVADGKEGDLKVLERAVPILSAQGNLSNITFEFKSLGFDTDLIQSIKAEVSAVIGTKLKSIEFEEEGDTIFRVSFDEISTLFIILRNRMFHFRLGERNINLGRVGGSETICKMCLPELIYWFGLLYTEIIRVVGKQVV